MTEQAVPEKIILKTLDSIVAVTKYTEMIPDPPVKFAQADAFGELTRALAYRLCGMNLRLVGNKGCGKNTLTQTVDWLLGVPQYRMDLEKRNEKRKVLIVLSDGLPSAYSKEAEAMDDVRSAVQDARRKGVIVIPIMYGVTDTEESYESYRQMYEKGIISTTSDNILDEFEKLLMKLIK